MNSSNKLRHIRQKLRKGDIVVFNIGNDQREYKVISDEYEYLGKKVVDLEGYAGEVAIEYLSKINAQNEVVSGEKSIDIMAYSVRIIVDNQIINDDIFDWRQEPNGSIELTLDEIAKQLKYKGIIKDIDVIYVWIELGLKGEIYQYNNYGDGKWYKHGVTKGYA